MRLYCRCDRCGKEMVPENDGCRIERSWSHQTIKDAISADGWALCEACTQALIKWVEETGHPEPSEEAEDRKSRDIRLDYYAGMVKDWAVDLPLPKHILDAMDRDGVVLISMAGHPSEGLEASGAVTVEHGRHEELRFERCGFALDYHMDAELWGIRLSDPDFEGSVRKVVVYLHHLKTVAVVARSKDLGAYIGGA